MNATAERFWHESDAMHALLIKHADELAADAIDAYETKRWPNGKVAGGKEV